MRGWFQKAHRMNVIVTIVCIQSGNNFTCAKEKTKQNPWWIIISSFQAHWATLFFLCEDLVECFCNVCFLLVRWSRCSLPSPQMWQETWTTRTWFTSSPMERKRTRSKTFLPTCHSSRKYVMWNRPTALEGELDTDVFTYFYVSCIVSVQCLLKSTGGSRQSFSFRPQKMDNSIASCLAFPKMRLRCHMRLIKLLFLFILYTQNHFPMYFS